jgi:NAD(P)-dependent dehydrogenase (short-subunit alcohol dehydrogenase family)
MAKGRFALTDRVAIVTGGGRGIGKSIALAFAEAGADVVVTARTTEQVQETASEVRALGRRGLALTADVAKIEDIEAIVRQTMEAFGKIDVLVNNAGISPFYTRAEKITPEMWDGLMAVNLRGLFFCCQAVGKVMIEQKRGNIINMASVDAVIGAPKLAAYAASKGGAVQITKTLALEWAQHNIRVNAIAPGFVATEFTRGMRENEKMRQMLVDMHPIGRLAEAEDIVGAALYLASDASSFVTGSTLMVDGGATIV